MSLILSLCSIKNRFNTWLFKSSSLTLSLSTSFFCKTFSKADVDAEIVLRWADSTKFLGGERIRSSGIEHVVDEIDLRWADSMRFLGGESGLSSKKCDTLSVETVAGILNVRFGELLDCGWGALEFVWNRVRRLIDWRGGRVSGGCCSLLGLREVGSNVGPSFGGLKLSEIQSWTFDVLAEGGLLDSSDLLRLCFAVFERISSLIPTTDLCLFFQQSKSIVKYHHLYMYYKT